MNISLALIDNDKLYITRLTQAFEEFFPNVHILSFSSTSAASQSLSMRPVDILLISENIYADSKDSIVKLNCKARIILVSSGGISKIDGYASICKYQRVDHLYRAIMTAYSDISNIVIDEGSTTGSTKLYTFISGAGGCGKSVTAAAYATYLARFQKQEVLYLDLSPFGSTDMFFTDTGNYTLTDCIMALINNKPNLGTQLKNFTRRDQSGVYFYASSVNALDWEDLGDDSLITMIMALGEQGGFDSIVVDAPNGWNKLHAFLAENSFAFYVISEATYVSNVKAARMWEMADTYFRRQNRQTTKMYLIYTCFTSGSQKIQQENIRELVTLPYMDGNMSQHDMVMTLSSPNYWS